MGRKAIQHNAECLSDLHTKHLCYIVSQGLHLTEEQEYQAMVKTPKFKCRHCGRVANSDKNLCEPANL